MVAPSCEEMLGLPPHVRFHRSLAYVPEARRIVHQGDAQALLANAEIQERYCAVRGRPTHRRCPTQG